MFIIDDIINAVGSHKAAKAQEDAAREAMGVQGRQFNQSRDDQMPWMQAGRSSLADLLRMTQGGFDASSMANDPGFQFRMAEGQKALERSASARGGLAGGGALKSLARYSQGLASDEYQQRFNRLSQLAGMGQGAAQNLGGLGANYANSMGNLYGAMGNAQSAGIMGVTNGATGGLRSAVNIGMIAAGVPPVGMMGGGGGMPGMGGGAIPTQQLPSQVSYPWKG